MAYKTIEECMKGKTAVISGGTSGIGKACVEAFCSAGVNVVTLGLHAKPCEEFVAKLNRECTGQCTLLECDVRDTERYREIINFTAEKYGRLDILVNCAGMMGEAFIDEVDKEDFQKFLDTNIVSYFMACKIALPYLRKSKGVIVNIGSIVTLTGGAQCQAYSATKGAISALTKSLAIDEARNGVRVTEIQPGHIETEIFHEMVERRADKREYLEYQNRVQWLGRGGKPEEVAYAALFLASDWASFITGAPLLVTGGYELGQGDRYIF